MGAEGQKRRAGEAAAKLVTTGMRVGLGSGSTTHYFIEELGRMVADGRLEGITAVATSRATFAHAMGLGIPMVELEGSIDLAVDGADEVASDLSLIKGKGGALLREKIVACAARRFVVVADVGKSVVRLGAGADLPVEIATFGWAVTLERLGDFGRVVLRGGDLPYVTDNGNYIVDITTGVIGDPAALDAGLFEIPGVMATGLFVGIADLVVIAHEDGTVERRSR